MPKDASMLPPILARRRRPDKYALVRMDGIAFSVGAAPLYEFVTKGPNRAKLLRYHKDTKYTTYFAVEMNRLQRDFGIDPATETVYDRIDRENAAKASA